MDRHGDFASWDSHCCWGCPWQPLEECVISTCFNFCIHVDFSVSHDRPHGFLDEMTFTHEADVRHLSNLKPYIFNPVVPVHAVYKSGLLLLGKAHRTFGHCRYKASQLALGIVSVLFRCTYGVPRVLLVISNGFATEL